MNVAIFDIDGTLTRTTEVDDASLVCAFERVFDASLPPLDWGTFFHSTDEGLCLEVCQRCLGRDPTREEIASAKDTFVAELRRRISQDPTVCRPVPGANEVLERLRDEGWRVGLASGAWPESARLKLASAGVRAHHLPATFSHALEDGTPALRERIVGDTIRSLLGCEFPPHGPETRIVYIGDGAWDARAARALGIGFLGVRHDRREERLRGEGVRTIIHDFLDLNRVLQCLTDASVPEGSSPSRAIVEVSPV
jgi:phosphoglycolate phosphatase-like HAD superfamily hydrolase